MSRAHNTILLKGKGHSEEGEADGAITPGMNVILEADGLYVAGHSVVGMKLACEDALQGNTVDTAYADGDRLFMYQPVPGDHINALVLSGENIDVGDKLDINAAGLFTETGAVADKIVLTNAKVHDAMATDLPAAAATDDMGLISGTPGTDAITLQGVDFGATTADEECAFEYILPPDYRAGSEITVRAFAGMLTTVSDGTATLDLLVHKDAGDGTVGSDLCTTAATTMNSLTFANIDFVVTPTGLVAGDKLILHLAFAASDTGNAGVMIQEIQALEVRLGGVGASRGRLEALEDSGGALGANTLLACRVLGL